LEPEGVCHSVASVPRCVGAVRTALARAPQTAEGAVCFTAGAPGFVWIYNILYAEASPAGAAGVATGIADAACKQVLGKSSPPEAGRYGQKIL
jgi:hypothetical protein